MSPRLPSGWKARAAWLAGGLAPLLLAAVWLSHGRAARGLHPRVGPVVQAVYGIGTATARHTFDLKLGVADTLEKLYAREGDAVPKGARLVALADLPPVRAPFAGVVTSLPFKEGETLFPQVPVLTLTDLKDPYIVVSLEQEGALRVRRGQPAVVSFETLRDDRLAGTVSAIYPQDGQFLVNIEVPHMPEGALVGMTTDVAIRVEDRASALQVPLTLVSQGQVRVERGGAERTVAVKLGAGDGTWAEVVEGDLQPSDLLLPPRNP
ncbi:MAG TPA: efflux RND transporter periplasmic adaptor subunit [bacterium]|nr:efflux RND transporter periplasmic adaptor subunit [bacterium]